MAATGLRRRGKPPYQGGAVRRGVFNQIDFTHYTPPTETRNWFHLGPVGDEFGEWAEVYFEDEYWSGDPSVLKRPQEVRDLLRTLPRRAKRDALRAMRGSQLRTELYALDQRDPITNNYVPGANGRPYTVTESLSGMRLEYAPSPEAQSQIVNRLSSIANQYVFFTFSLGSRTTQWERGHDPMTQFSFTADYDAYGQPLKQLAIAVPRGRNYRINAATDPEGGTLDTPFSGWMGDPYFATVSKSAYAQVDTGSQYMVDRVCRSTSYEILNNGTESVFELRDRVLNQELPIASGNAMFNIIGHSVNFYDGAAFNGLSFGQLGNYGALVRSETLVITDTIIAQAYGNTPECFKQSPDAPDWSESNGYPASFAGMLQNGDERLGYLPKDHATDANYTTGFYTATKQIKYDFHDDPATTKGLVLETRDPFDNASRIDYDQYKLLPVKAHQVIDSGTDHKLTTEAEYDYRVLQAKKITDPNGNQSEFGYTPLGLLEKSAIMGKEGENKGDTLDHPSVRMEYDFFAWKNSQQPVWVKTIQRINHWQDGINDETIEAIEYTDGFGRLLQTRSLAEDVLFGNTHFGSSGLPSGQSETNQPAIGVQRPLSSLPNVRVSGFQLYNNKGKVVEQYEPYFSKGFQYTAITQAEMDGWEAAKVKFFYDPRGQVVRTVNPDDSEQWILFGVPPILTGIELNELEIPKSYEPTPWENYSYDANDLAQHTHPSGSGVPSSHHWTPSSNLMDSLGRITRSVSRLVGSEQVVMNYRYDLLGNVLEITDALGRRVFTHTYDLGNKALHTWHIDSGNKRVVYDAMQKPVIGADEKGAESLNTYDTLNRLVLARAKDKNDEPFSLRQIIIYGDDETHSGLTASQAKGLNLIGLPYKVYDESGLLISNEVDFKGNILEKNRKVIKDDLLQTDSAYVIVWPELDDMDFETDSNALLEHKAHDGDLSSDGYVLNTEYDGLNRAIKVTLPLDVEDNRKEILPHYNRAGALERVEYDGTDYVNHIAYNCKGQRLLALLGNGVMTRYAYSQDTFRLLRQRTETFTQSGWEFTSAGSVKQDTAYAYDLLGNIVQITENRTDSGYGTTLAGTQGPTPDSLVRMFTYDPLYRLLSATGREGTNHSHNNIWNDPSSLAPTPGNTRAYLRSYEYDLMGNIRKMTHSAHLNSFTRNFVYDDIATDNRLSSIRDGSMSLLADFQYDANGNTGQSNTERFYEWNQADQLRFFKIDDGTTVSVYGQYRYAGGNRTKKYVKDASGNYTSTVYIEGVFEYQKLVKGANTYERNYTHIVDGKSQIATIRVGSDEDDMAESSFYIITDHLASSTVRLNSSSSAVIDREETYPFGETSLRDFAFKRYRYCGKEKDSESGLYYYGARYYAAWACRFISVDPLARDYPHLTPYNNAGNKPINAVDIDGKQGKNESGGADQKSSTNTTATPVGEKKVDQGGAVESQLYKVETVTTGVDGKTTTSVSWETRGVSNGHEFTTKHDKNFNPPGFSGSDDQSADTPGQDGPPAGNPVEETASSTDSPGENTTTEVAKDTVSTNQSEAVKPDGKGPEEGATNENTGGGGFYKNEYDGISDEFNQERIIAGVANDAVDKAAKDALNEKPKYRDSITPKQAAKEAKLLKGIRKVTAFLDDFLPGIDIGLVVADIVVKFIYFSKVVWSDVAKLIVEIASVANAAIGLISDGLDWFNQLDPIYKWVDEIFPPTYFGK
jgi:RHS repeat-associated protein